MKFLLPVRTKMEGRPPKFFDSLLLLVRQMDRISRISFYSRLALYFARASLGIGMLPLPRFDIYKNNPQFNMAHFRVEK